MKEIASAGARVPNAAVSRIGDSATASGLVDAALEVSAWECDLMRRLRSALEVGDEGSALKLARELVGLEEVCDETSH